MPTCRLYPDPPSSLDALENPFGKMVVFEYIDHDILIRIFLEMAVAESVATLFAPFQPPFRQFELESLEGRSIVHDQVDVT